MVILLVLLALMTAMTTTGRVSYLAPILEIFLLLYASFTGWSMFDRERQEGAMEYLLSLPISRSKLFLLKFTPRLTAVALVLLVFSFEYNRFPDHFLVTPFYGFVLFYFTVFLLSLTMSISMKSFLGTFFLSLILGTGLYFFIIYLDSGLRGFPGILQGALSLSIIPLAFFVLLQKFDIKPAFYFNIKFVPTLAVILLLVFGVTYLLTNPSYQNCLLTDQGYQMWTYSKRTIMIKNEKSRFVFDASLFPLFQRGAEIYASSKVKRGGKESLVRLNSETGELVTLLTIEPDWWLHRIMNSGVAVGERVYFLLTDNRSHQEYKILEVNGSEHRVLPLDVDFGAEKIHQLLGIAEDPLQFILRTDSYVYRVLEDGQGERLFSAISLHTWKDRVLVFNKKGMVLYKMGVQPQEIFRKNGIFRKSERRRQDTMKRHTLVRGKGGFYLFDMETGQMDSVPLKRIPYSYEAGKDGFRFIDIDQSEISVMNWKDGRMRPEKTWYSQLNPNQFRIIYVFSKGITIVNNKRCEVFLYDPEEGGGN